jgi:hypothetical protein
MGRKKKNQLRIKVATEAAKKLKVNAKQGF